MISHEGKGNRAWNRNGSRELPCKKVEDWNGECTKYERDDAKIPLGFVKGIKKVGQYEEEGRVEKGWIFLVIG